MLPGQRKIAPHRKPRYIAISSAFVACVLGIYFGILLKYLVAGHREQRVDRQTNTQQISTVILPNINSSVPALPRFYHGEIVENAALVNEPQSMSLG